MIELLREAGLHGGTVLDLGCGTGTLAALLAGAGYRVLGLDRSPAMLRWARRTAPGARFRVADLRRGPLPAADAAVSTFDTLNYLGPGELARLFRRVARALPAGGPFLFDVNVPAELRGDRDEVEVYAAAGATVVVRIHRDRRRGRIVHRVSSLRRPGAAPPPQELHVQRVHAPAAVARALRAAGFGVRRLPGYPGAEPTAGRVVFLARAPDAARARAQRTRRVSAASTWQRRQP